MRSVLPFRIKRQKKLSDTLCRRIDCTHQSFTIKLESEVWIALDYISFKEAKELSKILEDVNLRRHHNVKLSNACRIFALAYFFQLQLPVDDKEELKDRYKKYIGAAQYA